MRSEEELVLEMIKPSETFQNGMVTLKSVFKRSRYMLCYMLCYIQMVLMLVVMLMVVVFL